MEKIEFKYKKIRCRKEEFGYTIFDGFNSIQINETFYFIIKCIADGLSEEEIKDSIQDKYNLPNKNFEDVLNDIRGVKMYVQKKGWI